MNLHTLYIREKRHIYYYIKFSKNLKGMIIIFEFTDEDLSTLDRCVNDAVYFAENFLYDETGNLYQLEEHQKLFLRDQSQYRLLFLGRRAGKTLVSIIDILHKVIFNENYRVSIVSPTKQQAENVSEMISDMLARSTVVGSLFTQDNVYKKNLFNGSRIRLSTAGKDTVSSLVGSGVHMLYLDECQDMDDSLYSKIVPIMRGQAGHEPHMVQSGTPRGRDGFFYYNITGAKRIIEDGKLKRGQDDGMFSVHRKPTAFIDEDDNIIASGTPRITIEELEDDRNTMGNIVFKQEYCLEFLDDLGEVFSPALIEEATLDKLPSKFESKKPCVGGVDFGKKRNNTVLMIGELNSDGSIDIKWIKKWPLGTKYKVINDYLINTLPKRFPNFRKLVPDATGVGEKIIEDFEDVTAYEIEPVIFTKKSKVALVESAVNRLEDRKVKFISDKKFKKEMTEYKRDISKEDKVVYKKGESDDHVDAFILTVEAGRTVKPPRDPFVINLGQNIMNKIKGVNTNRQPSAMQQNRRIGLVR